MIDLTKLSLQQRAELVGGTQYWKTKGIADIPSIFMADGPHGLRKQRQEEGHLGLNVSKEATCFPTAVTLASGFSTENLRLVGQAISREATSENVDIVLAPGVNIKRTPLCGRNFEYFSEDALVSGEMGAAFVEGVQQSGTGACVKHFAANNLENYRLSGNSVVDMRALREVYLKPFEIVIKKSNPYAVMCAYNKLNGTFCSQNKWLLGKVLREDFCYDGAVISDWGAVANRVEALRAGLDLEMPGDVEDFTRDIVQAVQSGQLEQSSLDRAVQSIGRLVEKCGVRAFPSGFSRESHHALAGDIAADCAVLLKNKGALPLTSKDRLVVAGEMFENMRYQGAGSSQVNPTKLYTPKNAFDEAGIEYTFLSEAEFSPAFDCDKIVYFGGLTDDAESEGHDRQSLDLPAEQVRQLTALIKTGKPIVLVLFGGSPVQLPFVDDLNAVLNMYLPGQNGGSACKALLFGDKNPSGRLAETWFKRLEDVPFSQAFGTSDVEVYRESIFVGYRYAEKKQIKPLFAFGHGLSYTTFEYSNFSVTKEGGKICARLTVTNTGKCYGGEVVQLYSGKNTNTAVFKAEKELRAFAKLYLCSGESRDITLCFEQDDLAFFDITQNRFKLESGFYPIYVGAASNDIRLSAKLEVLGDAPSSVYSDEVVSAYENGAMGESDSIFEQVLQSSIPQPTDLTTFTLDTRFGDMQGKLGGRIVLSLARSTLNKQLRACKKLPESERAGAEKAARSMIKGIVYTTPRFAFTASGGAFTRRQAEGIVAIANGKILKGLAMFASKEKPSKDKPSEEKPSKEKPSDG